MSVAYYRAKFQLKDGRILTCDYAVGYSTGGPWNPPEWDVSAPEYKMDNEPIEYDDLPKGLHVIAARMYDGGSYDFWQRHFSIRDVTNEVDYDG